MRLTLAVLAVLLSMTANAQELPEKPEVQGYPTIDPATPIAEGMVWHVEQLDTPTGRYSLWVPRAINSCSGCGKPMTFKQAAFDRKAIALWGSTLAVVTTTVVVAATRPCVQQLTCREPYGRPTILKGMAFQVPPLVASWIGTAYFLRKGNLRLHTGGTRTWWVIPVMHQALSAAFMGTTLARF